MSILSAFLNPEPIEQEKTVYISKRFKDEDGNVVPFIIKSVPQDTATALSKKTTTTKIVKGSAVRTSDTERFTAELLVECTIQPDFRDAELCKAYGCVDPADVPGKMLTSGEFTRLTEEVMSLNGFDLDPVIKAEEEAKNS